MYTPDAPVAAHPSRVFRTWTGQSIVFDDFRPEQVDIVDIAQGLSHIPRANGQWQTRCSVASHSRAVEYAVWRMLESRSKLPGVLRETVEVLYDPQSTRVDDLPLPALALMWALLHDAAEAYTGDVTTPMKRAMPAEALEYMRVVERVVQLGFPRVYYPEFEDTTDANVQRRWSEVRNAIECIVHVADRMVYVAEVAEYAAGWRRHPEISPTQRHLELAEAGGFDPQRFVREAKDGGWDQLIAYVKPSRELDALTPHADRTAFIVRYQELAGMLASHHNSRIEPSTYCSE